MVRGEIPRLVHRLGPLETNGPPHTGWRRPPAHWQARHSSMGTPVTDSSAGVNGSPEQAVKSGCSRLSGRWTRTTGRPS
jgi:hypothetical protein